MNWSRERILAPAADFLQQKLSLKSLELIELDLPQKITFQSAIGVRKSRKALIVKWIGADGVIGYGESSCRPDPYYSDEFMEAGIDLVQNFIFPKLKAEMTYAELLKVFQGIRGWPFTKAAVEFAAHNYLRKKIGKTLWETVLGAGLDKIPVGISMGFQESLEEMIAAAEKNKAAPYRRLKFKIAPIKHGEDFEKTAEKVPHDYYSFDANGTFREADIEKMQAYLNVSETIEQPFPPSRFDIYLLYKKRYPNLKVCWDEEVKGLGDLVKLHALGVADEVNLKLGRVGGLLESLLIIDYCQFHSIPIWIGGMFETGIGRSLNIQIAAYLKEARAHDLSPSQRYFHEDVLHNPIEMDGEGYVLVDSAEQAEVNEVILEKYTVGRQMFAVSVF